MNTTGFETLKKNIIDMLEEQQLKLGFQSEAVYLYYPLSSLNRFFGTDADVAQMMGLLMEYGAYVKDTMGMPEFSHRGERFCIKIPPMGSEYVNMNLDRDGFTSVFINLIGKHGTTIDEVLALFDKYSAHVHKEKMVDEEFDWLIYFEDGTPDDYRYCITDEGCHLIYHRFTEADYMDMYGNTCKSMV